MPQLLHVDSSVRGAGSQSRALTAKFVDQWKRHNLDASIVYRDVGRDVPPHPTEAYTIANYTPPAERTPEMKKTLEMSDLLIDELVDADHIVFAVPMYNFSIPSTFKVYIDNLVRVGRTFGVTEQGGFEGLLTGKKTLVVTARGAMYGKGSPIASFDHQEPYLRTVLGFMGLNDIMFVHADGMDFASGEYRSESLQNAEDQLQKIATQW